MKRIRAKLFPETKEATPSKGELKESKSGQLGLFDSPAPTEAEIEPVHSSHIKKNYIVLKYYLFQLLQLNLHDIQILFVHQKMLS